ncbi:hypothetical protein PAXRUDRAFT_210642 [Paxillus rubicundulus Ve08.2h10]|uniref:Uncharacterized protein n=1 Tax=Paxillus rubicundulus Ve08.2h10 TaxID=930991 RepID=A0A0D0DTZ7_9AGAM|nr:hypothetical protein PAXRUDRAFT_210642 [Paxillus rubicundulus Ve08.2h10]
MAPCLNRCCSQYLSIQNQTHGSDVVGSMGAQLQVRKGHPDPDPVSTQFGMTSSVRGAEMYCSYKFHRIMHMHPVFQT